MRLRTRCKCGAKFEARGMGNNIASAWSLWQRLHYHCLGIKSVHETDDGKLDVVMWDALSVPEGEERRDGTF